MKTWAKATIGIGATLALAGVGFGLYKWLISEKHKEKKNEKGTEKAEGKANEGAENLSSEEAEMLVGKKVYAKSGGVNIRETPEVNNSNYFAKDEDVSWYDDIDNGLKENATGLIGTLEKVVKGKDKRDWYYVKLEEPITISAITASTLYGSKTRGTHNYGYVRCENVELK